MDNKLTTENVKFISFLMDSVEKVKDLFDEYCNGYYNLSEKMTIKLMLKAYNKAVIANNINVESHEDYVRKIKLLNKAYGNVESTIGILTGLMADWFTPKETNYVVNKYLKPTLAELKTAITKEKEGYKIQFFQVEQLISFVTGLILIFMKD